MSDHTVDTNGRVHDYGYGGHGTQIGADMGCSSCRERQTESAKGIPVGNKPPRSTEATFQEPPGRTLCDEFGHDWKPASFEDCSTFRCARCKKKGKQVTMVMPCE